ncbi:sigma-54 dependent transcriptional regulator [uncultured Roseobacter sp.]|uniref:sigma-54-dependent transcriptional regulator n=1 Tax=uncultured Roseobacter sp. TaxID=114847 RepID=UPI002610CEFC|nr:sigma-54 dependent transcriptional regulator [uncultured Roseobacter sp.]
MTEANNSVQGVTSVMPGFGAELANASVLIVDDEPGMRNFLDKTLSPSCARVDVTGDTEEASAYLDRNNYDVVVLDNIMPNQSGLDWLAAQQRIGLHSDVILMTAYADLDTAISAIRAGASDFLLKPFRSNQILNAISQSLSRIKLRRQNSVLRHELEVGNDLLRQRDALLGPSGPIEAARQSIQMAAAIEAHVVIRGEVGSGKQIAARMLHSYSSRAAQPFVWLQCYGVTEPELRTRLFGHIGAGPDGREARQDGMLRNVAGGTLFLEDVDQLDARCQNLLMELLSTWRYRPVDAERSFPLNIRLACSTTRALHDSVQAKQFRADLFYLLNVHEITLPPLRERAEDILELVAFFRDTLALRMGIAPPEISEPERRKLMAHDWPGNVMELRNTVERALIQGSFEKALVTANTHETETLASMEQRHILNVPEACEGNRAEAARRLGVARKTIDRKCQAWGL